MKKIKILLVVLTLILSIATFCSCSGKICSECGNKVEKGYTVLGNFLCEKCFF